MHKSITLLIVILIFFILFFGCTQLQSVSNCGDEICSEGEELYCEFDCGKIKSEITQKILDSKLLDRFIEESNSEKEVLMAPPPPALEPKISVNKSTTLEIPKTVSRHKAKTITPNAKPSAKLQKPDLMNKTIVIYNSNDTEALELAEYYATARGIPSNRVCEVQLPPGESARAKHLLATRKSILECMCDIIEEDTPGTIPNCDYTKYDEISENSLITHMAIIKGIPNIVYDTGWYAGVNSENPSFDFYLATSIYTDGNIFYSGSGGGNVNYNYMGYLPNYIDFQSSSSNGYSREIIPALDKILAYGRIEAINLERTKQLIDKTIEAEKAGFQGNILMENSVERTQQRHLTKTLLESYTNLFAQQKKECFDYLNSPYGTWNSDACRFGVNVSGDFPGEIIPPWRTGVSAIQTIPKAINMGFFSGINPFPNTQKGFDQFSTMLNWRKDKEECTPLCRELATETLQIECRNNSTDYFKELNTACVGGALGMIGHQVRSYPVQYYGFFPKSWNSSSGGIFEVTPPRVLEGGAFQNEKFIDNKYLRFGSITKVETPTCTLVDGSVEDCTERIGVNLINDNIVQEEIFLEPGINKKFQTKFRLRGSKANYLNLVITYKFYENAFSDSAGKPINYFAKSKQLEHLDLDDTWKEFELEFDFNTDRVLPEFAGTTLKLYSVSIGFWAIKGHGIYDFIDFDGIELLDPEGEDLLPTKEGSFEVSNEWTTQGDTAANAIDRLGAIAWWGSSSHHITFGWAFSQDQTFARAFFSGRTLGESLIKQLNQAMSGIIYGDPLYNPSGVKIFVNNGLIALGQDDSMHRYSFNENSESTALDIQINAFHGTNNLNKTNWSVSVCYDENIWSCNEKASWTEIESGNKAVFEYQLKDNLLDLIENKSIDSNLILWIKAWNPGEEDLALSNYGSASFALANCGNNLIEGGEICDAYAYGGDSCVKRGFAGGTLTCSADCQTVTEENCIVEGCGNGLVEDGEICDTINFYQEPSCIARGFAGGTLTCSTDCQTITEENCIAAGCGNDIKDADEYCDGKAAFVYESCVQEGFCGGESICKEDCSEFDFSDCFDFDDARCEQNYSIDLNFEKNKLYHLTLPIIPLNKEIRDIFNTVPTQTDIFLRKNKSWKGVIPLNFGQGKKWHLFGKYEELVAGIGKGFTLELKTNDLNITIFGKPLKHPQKVNINGESSLIGIPFCNELYDSVSLISELNSVNNTCTKILYRSPTKKDYYYSLDNSFTHENGIKNIFSIDNNTSYWIYCDAETNFDWKPSCGTINLEGNLADFDLFVDDKLFDNKFFKQKKKIKIKKGTRNIIEFEHDFKEKDLNLDKVTILTSFGDGEDFTIINNLDLGGETKTIFVDKNGNSVCVLDAEAPSLTTVKENCVRVDCPGTHGGIECEIDGDYFKISGLTHSGVIADYGYCGNTFCDAEETFANCPIDCEDSICTSTTYSDWDDCNSDGLKSKTLISKEPVDCEAEEIITKSCTPPCTMDNFEFTLIPEVCPINEEQTKEYFKMGVCTGGITQPTNTNIDCNFDALVCTYTYSNWGSCSASLIKTRTVLTSLPDDCEGNPILVQECVPPCTYTYSDWSNCSATSTKTRTILNSAPEICEGTPNLVKMCVYSPPQPPPPGDSPGGEGTPPIQECTTAQDCNTNSYTGNKYCNGSNVVRKYITNTCENYICKSTETEKTLFVCDSCSNGACVNIGNCTTNTQCSPDANCTNNTCETLNCPNGYIVSNHDCIFEPTIPPEPPNPNDSNAPGLPSIGDIFGDDNTLVIVGTTIGGIILLIIIIFAGLHFKKKPKDPQIEYNPSNKDALLEQLKENVKQ